MLARCPENFITIRQRLAKLSSTGDSSQACATAGVVFDTSPGAQGWELSPVMSGNICYASNISKYSVVIDDVHLFEDVQTRIFQKFLKMKIFIFFGLVHLTFGVNSMCRSCIWPVIF